MTNHHPVILLSLLPQVPNTVKAALDECLSSLAAAFRDLAPRLLDRLMQCAAVVPNAPLMPGVPRLDLITQINEIEVGGNDLLAMTCPPGSVSSRCLNTDSLPTP